MWKPFLAGFALLFCLSSTCAQRTRAGQDLPFPRPGTTFPLALHVYGIHMPAAPGARYYNSLVLDVTFNGKKLELDSDGDAPLSAYQPPATLTFGDLHARALKNATGTHLGDGVELLLPSNRVLRCTVTGIFE